MDTGTPAASVSIREAAQTSPAEVLARAREDKHRNRWAAIAEFAPLIPATLSGLWLAVADEVAFALGQLRRTDDAAALLDRAFAIEPTRRRASALAYLYYAALFPEKHEKARGKDLARGEATPRRDREADRRGFIRWLQEALRREPDSIKDLYRLGIFEAQVETRHDVPALRAFQRAVAAYRSLPDDVRALRPDLRKPYLKSLYAGARSAFRLGRFQEARKLVFACIREDRETNHVEPVHKFLLAAKVCAAQGQYEHAERALRLALDAPGPRTRDYLYGTMAEVVWRQGRGAEGAAWIERYVEPHRRSASLWRLLGDIRRDAGRPQDALVAYENALRRDQMGRHLTLVRIGDLHREAGRPKEAERAYEQAAAFRRKRYLSEDRAALRGLIAVAEARGNKEREGELRQKLAALGRFPPVAPSEES